MFLLKISSQGPKTLLKRALSSLTHLRESDFDTTVAALGLSVNKAISPK